VDESDPAPAALERLRALCMAQPGATERRSHGEPAWFAAAGKQFAMFLNRHHDDRVALWCAAPPGAQEPLIESDPERYFRPPYVGHRGWVGAYLDIPGVAWEHVEELIDAAHLTVAPPRRSRAPRGA
jgi:hypothetical protein